MTALSPTLAGERPSPLAFLLEPKWLITMLISLIVIIAAHLGAISSLTVFAVALSTAVIVESLFSLWTRGHLVHIQSAYISGVSVTILTNPQQGLIWPFALAAAISISSKYVLRYRGRHLWNPTNLGITLMLILAPAKFAILSTQWNNNLAPLVVIWCVGLLVTWRARILHVTLTYVTSFLVLGWVRTWFTGDSYFSSIAPITGPMYQLFIFFMITDPPTTVRSMRGRMLVAFLIALVEAGLRLLDLVPWIPDGSLFAAPAFFALATVGPIAKFIDLRREAAGR